MMAELEIDQSNLPRVQEVCQCFAVLEDGVLAHNLQEQEIEQYYTTNIQKNQLVQNDIRVAKRLQDEEEEEQAQQSSIHRQASRQLEEEDFEYARIIQEEIQRCAEEARRREQEDEEIAKRMQEEEMQRITRRSRGQEDQSEGASLQPEPGEASLDLGELQQVLEDEELAHRLQEEEEKLLRRNSQPSPSSSYPEGDFRVAQVAQDEEIARFMQKQEMKSKRRSRELEGPASWREHRAMINHHDRRAARDRPVRVMSRERGLTQRAFLPPLRTAPQRTSHPAPSPLYHKASRSETLRRSWTRPSRPGGKAQRASEWDQQARLVSHFPCPSLAYMTSWRSLLSSHLQSGKRTNQHALNPKRRRKIASNSNFQHIVLLGVLIYTLYFITLNTSSATELSLLMTLRLKPAAPISTLDQWDKDKELREVTFYNISSLSE